MIIPLIETQEYTAINVKVEPGSVNFGILILEPTDKEFLEVRNFQVYITDDLIGQPHLLIVTEREMEIVKKGD